MQPCVSVKSVLFLRRIGGGHAASHVNSYSVSMRGGGGVLVCTVTPCQGLSEKRLHVLMHVRLIGLIEDFKLPIDVSPAINWRLVQSELCLHLMSAGIGSSPPHPPDPL